MIAYKTENDIRDLVARFESGAIARADWRHAEHLIVALYYLERDDFDAAAKKMRAGIFNLLRAFGVDLRVEMPYHETLTIFWMRTIDDFNRSRGGFSLVEKTIQMIAAFDKDHPLRFYSRELLFSDRARREFVDADLRGDEK